MKFVPCGTNEICLRHMKYASRMKCASHMKERILFHILPMAFQGIPVFCFGDCKKSDSFSIWKLASEPYFSRGSAIPERTTSGVNNFVISSESALIFSSWGCAYLFIRVNASACPDIPWMVLKSEVVPTAYVR